MSGGEAGAGGGSAADAASEMPVLERGEFFRILDGGDSYVLADMTKRGLEARSRSVDEGVGVEADKGVIHDMDGIGREVPIRWFFPKGRRGLGDALAPARRLEEKYTKLREMTCPDGGGSGGSDGG